MFERKIKEVEFEGGNLTIAGLPVYRAIVLREKFRAIKKQAEDNPEDHESADITDLKIEVILDCLQKPEMDSDKLKQLDLETLEDLFDVVCKSNGMIPPGNQ